MEHYLLLLTLVGFIIFTMAWMPAISKKTGISYAVYYTLFGYLLYSAIPDHLPVPLPQQNESLSLHLTELIVIISLMGTGIKIDRKFSLKNWSSPLRLLGIAMPLCLLSTFLIGYYFLDIGLPASLLLAAVLAPTDPVLAADVQVGPPNDAQKSETRFSLTAEAGMNDGVAFPFTWLAIVVGLAGIGKDSGIGEWLAFDLVYRIAGGFVIGYLSGKFLGFIIFRRSEKYKILRTGEGLLAISMTLLVYGIAEAAHAYGFIAVFVCAVAFRHYEKGHRYHKELHSFTDQIERLLLCILLFIFGGALASGILAPITWQMALFSFCSILVIRPLSGLLSLYGVNFPFREKLAVSFFGIRGMGSLFYLSFGFSKFSFPYKDELWAIVFLTILLSILFHGLTSSSAIRHLQKQKK